jgi:hypothetical protein
VRLIRAAAAGSILVLALSACEMNLRFTTLLEEDGSGTFAVGVALDAEARLQMEAIGDVTGDPANGLAPIYDLFDGLESVGWALERDEPAGGVAIEASTSFRDPDDFGRVLDELRGARTSEGTGLSGLVFELDVDGDQTFLRSEAGMSGVLDMSGIDPSAFGQRLAEELRQRLRIEIRAELPGAIRDVEGAGAVGENVVVWRPEFGSRAEFGAVGSSVRTGNLLLALVPALFVLGVLGWFFIGRRRPRTDEPDRLLVLTPQPNGHASRAAKTEQPVPEPGAEV